MKCVVCDTDEDHDDDDNDDDDDDLVEMWVDICFVFQTWLASTPQICFGLLLGFSSPPALLSNTKITKFLHNFPVDVSLVSFGWQYHYRLSHG